MCVMEGGRECVCVRDTILTQILSNGGVWYLWKHSSDLLHHDLNLRGCLRAEFRGVKF